MDAGCAAQGGYSFDAPTGTAVPTDRTDNVAALINQNPSNFGMHDHVYPAPHVPDANRAWALYKFNNLALVKRFTVIEHVNGVDELEGFAGDSESTMVSVGRAVVCVIWF